MTKEHAPVPGSFHDDYHHQKYVHLEYASNAGDSFVTAYGVDTW